jgi:hypothetical protein
MSGPSNPYVGPRPIQTGEALYGRERELRELFHRLQAWRIVLLHSPSGAGKSSLVQAGLIPRLREARYDVWRPIRVNLDPHALGAPVGTNRYLLSALLSLEEELPVEHRRSPAALSSLDLLRYVQTRPRRKVMVGRPVVLLFDQFEEVLTIDPWDIEGKQQFFDQLGRALDTPDLCALFVLREDWLGALAPYRDRVPTELSNTLRLDLLGRDGAREVAESLARDGGRSFPAVEHLVQDLAQVRVQQPDGSFRDEVGPHVEPVQLQVVCRRLWEAMPEGDRSIDDEDVARYANVSTALADYYAHAVRHIARGDFTTERRLRAWVGERLISGGLRAQVRREAAVSGGLDNALIDALRDSYLVRSEPRAGSDWFELSHDRLVAPVLHDNEAWEKGHLHPMQVQARLWEDGKRAEALLLVGSALEEATAWAATHPGRLMGNEPEYLETSTRQQEARRAAERRGRRTQAIVLAFALLSAVAAGVSYWQFRVATHATIAAEEARADAEGALAESEKLRQQATEAQEKAKDAETLAKTERDVAKAATGAKEEALADATHQAKLAADATADALAQADAARLAEARARDAAWMVHVRRFKDEEPQRALLGLAEVKDTSIEGWRELAIELLQHSRVITRCRGDGARLDPDGDRMLVWRSDGGVEVRRSDGTGSPLRLRPHLMPVVAGAWAPDGLTAATVAADGTAWLHDLQRGVSLALVGHTAPLRAVVFSPSGDRLATAGDDGAVWVWRLDGTGEPWQRHPKPVRVLAWGVDGQEVASGSDDGTVIIGSSPSPGRVLVHDGPVVSVSFLTEGTVLTGSEDGTVRLWEVSSGKPLMQLLADRERQSPVRAVRAENRSTRQLDGSVAVVRGEDRAHVWYVGEGGEPVLMTGFGVPALLPDARGIVALGRDFRLLLGSADGTVYVESIPDNEARTEEERRSRVVQHDALDMQGHPGGVVDLQTTPDFRRVLVVAAGGEVFVWRIGLKQLELNEQSSEDLRRLVREGSSQCVPVVDRISYHGLDPDEAAQEHTRCMQDRGTTAW